MRAHSVSQLERSSNGTISSAAKREVESAVLSRARQLRLKASDSVRLYEYFSNDTTRRATLRRSTLKGA